MKELAELARLAGLQLSQSEAEQLGPQLEALLVSVERVLAAPPGEEPPRGPAPSRREDVASATSSRAVLLAAPQVERDHIVVEQE